ncbi:MAG: polysaccharide biosynthesis protein [Clostridia bacterium]|nr:polysaccharide biosynthesis protein [Clostridia bacterium]
MSERLKNTERERYGVLGGAISLSLSTLIVKLLGVFYKVPLAAILGDVGMGYFNSAYTVYAFFYLLCTAGVPKAIMILISEKTAENKGEEIKKIMHIAFRAFLLLGVGVCAAFIIFSQPLSAFIGNSNSRATMLAVAPSIIFVSLSGVLRGYLSAGMRMVTIAFSQIVEGAGKLVFGLVLAHLGSTLGMPLQIISAMTILGVTLGSAFGFIFLYIMSKNEKTSNNSRQKYKFGEIKATLAAILKISLPITLSGALMSITGIIDLSLIMRRLESIGYTASEAAGLYGNYTTLAVSIFNLIISIITPISLAFMPVFTRASAGGDELTFSSSLKSALDLSMVVSAPLMIGSVVYSKEILALLFGNSGIDVGAPLLSMLSGGVIFMSALLVTNSALESRGHTGVPLFAMLVGSAVKLIVSGMLLGNENYGISGAPLGTVISYGVSLIISVIALAKVTGSGVPLFSTVVLPHITALASVMTSRYIYDRFLSSSGASSLFVAIGLCALIYLVFSLSLGAITKRKLKIIAKYTNFS